MKGSLYIVGTPIGNLGDISPRAAQTLGEVDFIAAEDTRVSIKLLNHLGIKKPLVSYYEHNKKYSGEKILARMEGGESCALITDAGMPAVSDPGYELVKACAEAGIETIVIPGPSALIAAVAGSALPSGRFTFEGFLSTAKQSRFRHLEELRDEKRTMIFYEAPHKLLQTLRDMLDAFGNREISIARELTKMHEEFIRTTLAGAIEHFELTIPRGEFVLVLSGMPEEEKAPMPVDEALKAVNAYRAEGNSLRKAAELAATETGYSKNELYSLYVKTNG